MRKKEKYIIGVLATIVMAYWGMFYLIDNEIVNTLYVIQEIYGAGEIVILVILLVGTAAFFRRKVPRGKKILVCSIFSIMTLLHLGGMVYWANQYTCSGAMAIAGTKISGQNYYFYVESSEELVRIKCSKEVFDNLIADKDVQYRMELKGNNLTSSKASLKDIDLINYIDNRIK